MNKKRLLSVLKVVLTLALVFLSVYFSVREIDFQELGRSFETANYLIALILAPVTIASHYLRAMRWKVILRHVHPEIPMGKLFGGVMVGYFMNNVIMRSGEFARPYVTAQGEKNATFSSLFGTIIVERVIDVMGLLIMIAVVLVFDESLFKGFEKLGVTKQAVEQMIYPAIGLFIAIILVAPSKLGMKMAQFAVKPLPEKLGGKILDIFAKLQTGFGALRSWDQIAIVALETAAIYFLYMLPLYIMFFAMPSVAGVTPTMFDALKILILTAIAFTVAPTPGAFGVFHFTAKIAAVKILQFTEPNAVAFATIAHFVPYVTVMIVGGYFLVKGNISFKDLLGAKKKE